jgi:uncharacterized protein YjbJ (UPF0337 family)
VDDRLVLRKDRENRFGDTVWSHLSFVERMTTGSLLNSHRSRRNRNMDEHQTKGATQDAAGGLTGNVGWQAEGKVDQAAGKLKGQFGSAAGRAGDMANEAVDEISAAAGDATQTVRGAAGAIGDKVYDAGARTGQYVGQTVKQQPLLSLIGAAAIGYVLAFLLHSPSSPLAPPVRPRRYF